MSEVPRDSSSHPIEVGWVVPGSLGLTFAPGKHGASLAGPPWARDLRLDLARLRELGVNVLVPLLEDRELVSLAIPDLVAEARRAGFDVIRFPIPDGHAPSDMAAVRRLVDAIVEKIDLGDRVVVHCRGGLGRAGTIGGATLLALGVPLSEALARLEHARGKSCPENEAQRVFLRDFASTLEVRPLLRPTILVAKEGRVASSTEQRFLGATLGAAIGDAMGHPTEFVATLDALHARFGPRGVEGFALYWEQAGKRFAPFTDDTQMAEAVMRALVAAGAAGDDLDGAMERLATSFVSWAFSPRGGHRAPGRACLVGCHALADGVPWHSAGEASAGGCGSVMRAFPFGLAFHRAPERAAHWAVQHSRLTHGDPIAKAACAAMATGVALTVADVGVGEVLGAMISAARLESDATATMMADAVAAAERGEPPDDVLVRLQGWAAHEAIAAACYIVARHAEDARAAILEGANTVGDSDSIATLAGALVGARVGLAGLPPEWVRDVERSGELLALARALFIASEPNQLAAAAG